MIKLLLFILSFLILGCNPPKPLFETNIPEFEKSSFDVVQKQLIIEPELPNHLNTLISQWFDYNIKISGFDGDMKFIITDFNQDISSIVDGKRIDLTMSFKVHLNKPSLSQTKLIEGNVSSFGELTGNFSLSEFDTIIKNTQTDLVVRLSRDLQSKI